MTRAKTLLIYLAMVAAAVGLFFLIVSAGNKLSAPPYHGALDGTIHLKASDMLTHVLLALVTIILCARGLGWVFRRFNQPPVLGEMIAGIMLGPSLLGRVAPGAFHFILPDTVAPYLSIIANIGVILYMFLVGVELDTNLIRRRTESSIATSHASIIAPFLFGSTLALLLYPLYSASNVPFVVFALFMGIAMSVTAFPVLARILTDDRIERSPIGVMALACAAVDDVTAWCLFALVVSIAKAHVSHSLNTLVLTVIFIFTVLVIVRPIAVRFARRHDRRDVRGQGSIVVACAALLLAALATQSIGIHALFGAFLVGAIIPHDSSLARDIRRKFEDLVVVLFLPTFFAFTGLRTQIGLVHGLWDWVICAVIIIVASLGKFGGATLAARLTGMDWCRAASLGILMNTRGLMELIVLNVGMDLGVLTPTLFAMLVLMAIATTLATTPALRALTRESERVAVEQSL